MLWFPYSRVRSIAWAPSTDPVRLGNVVAVEVSHSGPLCQGICRPLLGGGPTEAFLLWVIVQIRQRPVLSLDQRVRRVESLLTQPLMPVPVEAQPRMPHSGSLQRDTNTAPC